MRATGKFDVKLTPQTPDERPAAASIGRLNIDKQFFGDLEATSAGLMVAVGTPVEGSAGYVAMEIVTGSLHGRSGSFALQHNGTMARGAPSLTVSVVPDSGSGQLTGLSGQMEIIIANGDHAYVFDYTLSK